MQAKTEKLWLSTSTLLIVGLVSCRSLASVGIGISNIGDVRHQQNIDTTVYVQGKVGDRIQLIGAQVYEVADPTGTIWVLTQEPVPKQDTQVLIEGKVGYEDIPAGTQNFGEAYLIEQQRLEAEAAQPTSEP